MRRLATLTVAALMLAGCGSSDATKSGSTAATSTGAGTLTRAKPGDPGDLSAGQRRSATRACAPIRQLPGPPDTKSYQTSTAVATTLEQPTLATGAQLDRIAHARTKTNRPLLELAQAYQQLATAYNALATVSHSSAALLAALQQRARTAARIVALQARALGLPACVPR